MLSRASREAFRAIERVDRALSDYREDSELSRLSQESGGRGYGSLDLCAEFLQGAHELSVSSSGAFDVSVGPLVDAWCLRSESPEVPSEEKLQALRELVGYRRVQLRVGLDGLWYARLERRGMRLDPGGLGKGFAVDRAVRVLQWLGVKRALVNFSGCMFALGTPPGEPSWARRRSRPLAPEPDPGHDLAQERGHRLKRWVPQRPPRPRRVRQSSSLTAEPSDLLTAPSGFASERGQHRSPMAGRRRRPSSGGRR